MRIGTRWILVIFAAIIFGAIAVYVSLWFVRVPDKGVTYSSQSLAEAEADGLFVGKYTPSKQLVSLEKGVILHFADAWIEHSWRIELTPLLKDKVTIDRGYYLHIPIDKKELVDNQTGYRAGLEIVESDRHVSSSPGIGYSPEQGCFIVFLDDVPKSVSFAIRKKRANSWADSVTADVVRFDYSGSNPGHDLNSTRQP